MSTSIYDLINPANQTAASSVNSSDTVTVDQSNVLKQASITQIAAQVANPVTQIANATNPDAGILTGAELVTVSRGAGVLQRALNGIAQWIVQTYQGFTQSGAGAVTRTITSKFSDSFSVNDFSSPHAAAIAAFNGRFNVPAGTTITLNIPTDVATIQTALTAIQYWDIFGTLILQVADGTYTISNGITLTHPFGQNIQLLGNTVTPTNCVLNFSTAGGFYVATGQTWGAINGFSIQNTSGSKTGLGILTDGGIYTKIGPNILVNNFYYGIAARNGGVINASGNSTNYVQVTNAGDVGIWAFLGSYVNAEYARVSGSIDSTNNLGGGFVAEFDSSIDATYAQSTGNYYCGFSALSGSSIRAWNTIASNNGGATNSTLPSAGYVSGSMGTMEVFSGTSTNNTGYAYATDGTTQIAGIYSLTSSTGNTLGISYLPWQIKSDSSTSINSGSFAINTTGPNVTGNASYFDMNTGSSGYNIKRWLVNGSEIGREQFTASSSTYNWYGSGISGLQYHPSSGSIALGVSAPVTTATSGFFQIPKMAGAPTGTAVNDTGYAPLIFDSTNTKLWVWTGSAWKGVVIS